jgi:hypothetical protein
MDRCHSCFHRNNCCDNNCCYTTCGSTVAPNVPSGEKIAPPKNMPKGGEKTEVRILTPSGTVPSVTPSLETAPAVIVPSAGAEIRSPF